MERRARSSTGLWISSLVRILFSLKVWVAAGFGFLAFWWLFKGSLDVTNIQVAVLSFYYIFFCLFMLASAFRIHVVMDYCGFLKHPWLKSAFYLLCATLALPDVTIIVNDCIGGVFALLAILNLVNKCRKPEKEVEA